MPFNIELWKEQTKQRLAGWKPRLDRAGTHSIYYFIAGVSLLPVAQAVHSGDWGALTVLGASLGGAVSTNLLANVMQKLKDKSDAEVAQILEAEAASTPAIKIELDALLEKMETLKAAEAAISDADKNWFITTLRAELKQMNSFVKYEANLIGDGAIAEGNEAVAVGAGATYIKGDYTVTQYAAPDPQQLEQARVDKAQRTYLQNLRNHCKALPLAALGGEEGAEAEINLDHVYIDLDTTYRITPRQLEKIRSGEIFKSILLEKGEGAALTSESAGRSKNEPVPLPLLDAASGTESMVVLGDPGAGKSTFVKKLLAWQAASLLGECEPPAHFDPDLLPVLIILRDLVPALRQVAVEKASGERQADLLTDLVSNHLRDELNRHRLSEFATTFFEFLETGRICLVLDGLDEVPSDLRSRMRHTINALIHHWQPKRIIVTCRVRSYVGAAVLPDFQSFTIERFDDEKIGNFVRAWYRRQHEFGRLEIDQAEKRAADLISAATSDDLKELSSNPMMLTSMAIIHQKEIGLPKERVRLYNLVVDVLLNRWQKFKVGEDELASFLKDDLRLRATMERLAYEAQRAGVKGTDVVDLPRKEALVLLEEKQYLGSPALADEFLSYVDQRAGLLWGRGGDDEAHPAAYGFPHRTFQEYLAGCWLTGQRDLMRTFMEHAAEGDRWNLAAILGAEELYFNRRNVNTLLDLAYMLCLSTKPKNEKERRALLWSGEIARLIGLNAIENDTANPDGGEKYLRRLRPRLVDLFYSSLSPAERVEAGRVLAKLGDPRPEVLSCDAMQFCHVPAGAFWMGTQEKESVHQLLDERPAHKVTLKDYWIGRYLVTNAQFGEFVKNAGYANPDFWMEARQHGYWKDGQFQGRFDDAPRQAPYDFGEPFNLANHPVVGVSWYEALAFTRWLHQGWKAAGILPKKGWEVRLPSEAQWEKAARGGLAIPDEPRLRMADQGLDALPKVPLVDNLAMHRVYPWEGEFNLVCTNTAEAGLRTTSAVGCFPGGVSPVGAMDMIGNVWEWTSSLTTNYPYQVNDGRENSGEDKERILRGGSFLDEADLARCAYRYRGYPNLRYWYYGFRVSVSPVLPA